MITLALDTSTPTGSVAVMSSGEVIFEETFKADRSHSSSLFAALERARTTFARLDQIAVGLGPGS
jgi:tRNA A37 threonylcarbamoyladenosine modification protein TsaB